MIADTPLPSQPHDLCTLPTLKKIITKTTRNSHTITKALDVPVTMFRGNKSRKGPYFATSAILYNHFSIHPASSPSGSFYFMVATLSKSLPPVIAS